MNRVKALRRAAALVSVGTVSLLAAVVPANADAATGVFAGDARGGEGVFVAKDGQKPGDKPTHTALFALKTDNGETLKVYCVDFETNIQTKPPAKYTEVPWGTGNTDSSTFAKNASKINWLLQNGYPNLDESALQAAVEKALGVKFDKALTDAEAIAGTQAAAWFFSDGEILDKNHPTEHAESADNVKRVYGYLTSDKFNKGITEQPKPELTLDPTKKAGKPGDLIGPFTVTTNADSVVVSAKVPDGVKLTDKDGKELPAAAANAVKAAADAGKYDFFVKVPAGQADGKADLTVKGDVKLTLGRKFASLGADGKPASQGLILAQPEKVHLETNGEASWSAAGTTPPTTTTSPAAQPKDTNEELAKTGASIMTPVLIGVVLVAGGVGALLFQRRRRGKA